MKKLTYVEARDKIWNAYFRGEIEPYDPEFCFCGTLAKASFSWMKAAGDQYYTTFEYAKMESALLRPLNGGGILCRRAVAGKEEIFSVDPNYEELLFSGMLAALEVLKQIHRERNDYIPEDEPLLTQRKAPCLK